MEDTTELRLETLEIKNLPSLSEPSGPQPDVGGMDVNTDELNEFSTEGQSNQHLGAQNVCSNNHKRHPQWIVRHTLRVSRHSGQSNQDGVLLADN